MRIIKIIYNHLSNNIKLFLIKKLNRDFVYRKINGSLMKLAVHDQGICKELILTGTHEKKSTEYLEKIVKSGQTVVDIGANIGYFVLLEKRQGAKVIAIEPSVDNFEVLKHNLKINSFNAEVHNIVISDYEGTTKFYISEACNRSSLHGSGKYEVCKVTTIDKLLKKKNVNLVRMDVEGSEMSVFRGMEKTLEKGHLKHIFVELHPVELRERGSSIRESIDFLEKYSYVLKRAYYEADLSGIKVHSVKIIIKKALKEDFFKTIVTPFRTIKLEKEFKNKASFIKNPHFENYPAEIFFEKS